MEKVMPVAVLAKDLPAVKFVDRREFPRILTTKLKCKIETLDNNKIISADISNISENGMLVYADQSMKLSQKVCVHLTLPDIYGIVKANGRVIWVMEKKEEGKVLYGINFPSWEGSNTLAPLKKYAQDNTSPETIIDRRFKKTAAEKISKSERRTTKPIFKKCIDSPRIAFLEKHKDVYFRNVTSRSTHMVKMREKHLISFSQCDYLGLSANKKITDAIAKGLKEFGPHNPSSRLLGGTWGIYKELEKKLADFAGGEDCITYSVGYMANLGCLSQIAAKNDYLIVDSKAHASIMDATLLSQSNIVPFMHNNMKDLEKNLNKYKGNKLIVTDGVFSMDGDIANLPEIYNLSQKYDAGIFVDDAHGFGVLGNTGAGTIEHFGLQGKIDITMGTLNKAFACLGGFIVAKKPIINYLRWTSRPFIFSGSIPPPMVMGLLTAIDIIKNDSSYRDRLWRNINFFRTSIKNLGFNIGNSQTAVIPILIKDELKAYKMALMLEEAGIYADAVFYPAVRKGESRIRLMVNASHTLEDLETSIQVFKETGQALNLIN